MAKYTSRREDLGEFIEDCGASVFADLRAEEAYFNGSPRYSTISRYRSGDIQPPFNYLAQITRLCIERALHDGNVEIAKTKLARLNELISEHYPDHQALRSEAELAPFGNAFMRERWGDDWQGMVPFGGRTLLTNLPDPPDGFVGYEEQLDTVQAWMRSDERWLFLMGMDGAGKTTLALQAAHGCVREERPAVRAVVWVSAKDRPDKVMWWEDVLDAVLDVLRYHHAGWSPAIKADKVRAILAEQPTLIILDNYNSMRDADLERWIRDLPAPSKILLTTHSVPRRDRDGARVVPLDGLGAPSALAFVHRQAKRMGLAELASSPDATLLPLVVATAGNPLLIRLALDDLEYVGDLVEAAHYASHREILGRKWEQIGPGSVRHLWMATALFDESMAAAALGAAAAVEPPALYDGLRELVQRQVLNTRLLARDGRVRYTLHPTVRSYALRMLAEEPTFAAAARRRWAEYHIAVAGCLAMPETPERYWNTSTDVGLQPIDEEWPNLARVLAWAAEPPQAIPVEEQALRDTVLVELMVRLVHYMDKRGRFRERLAYAHAAADAAARLGQHHDEALFRVDALGWTLIEERRYEEALVQIHAGLAIATQGLLDDQQSAQILALAYTFIARIHLAHGTLDVAAVEISKALVVPCVPSVRSRVTMIAGEIACAQGEYAVAERHFLESITQSSHDRVGVYWLLGYNYLAQAAQGVSGALAKAEQAFARVQREQEELTIDGVRARLGIAEVYRALGRIEDALRTAYGAQHLLLTLYAEHKLLGDIEEFIRGLSDGRFVEGASGGRDAVWPPPGMKGWLPRT